MFPLKNRKLIRGAEAHVKAGLGIAADYVAIYTELYLPFDGRVETYWGKQGGNWLRLTRPNGDKLEFAHLSKYLIKPGNYKQGTLAAITGNTGQITTIPHLHIQIIKNNFRLDPESYDWEIMSQIKTQKKGGSLRLIMEAGNIEEWKSICKVFGKDPDSREENVKDA